MKLRLAVIYVAVIFGLLFGLSQLSRIPVFQVVTREFTQSSNVFLNYLYFSRYCHKDYHDAHSSIPFLSRHPYCNRCENRGYSFC